MPANSAIFNRFFLVLTAAYVLVSPVYGQLPSLSSPQYQWLGQQVFGNECNQRLQCLTHWNEGEDFPSLGIGHFIWYGPHQQETFEETFPALLTYLKNAGALLPSWLNDPISAENPWPDRSSFYKAIDSTEMQELSRLLQSTMDLQAEFIVQRLNDTLAAIIASFPPARRTDIRNTITTLANSNAPMGHYALIDYLHFKGSGLNPSERYQQQGWGLRQVLERMNQHSASIENFVAAASRVLQNRVANAPVERNEQRWLAGWINRLQTYLSDPEIQIESCY